MTTQDTGLAPAVAVLGGGVMGGTLVAALRTGGWPGERVTVADQDAAKADALAREHGVRTAGNRDAVAAAARSMVYTPAWQSPDWTGAEVPG